MIPKTNQYLSAGQIVYYKPTKREYKVVEYIDDRTVEIKSLTGKIKKEFGTNVENVERLWIQEKDVVNFEDDGSVYEVHKIERVKSNSSFVTQVSFKLIGTLKYRLEFLEGSLHKKITFQS